MSAVMTFEEAAAEVAGKTRLSIQDLQDLHAVYQEDLADEAARDVTTGAATFPRLTLLVTTYRDAGNVGNRSEWDVVIDVLGKVSSMGGFVTALTSVVIGVIGAATSLKNL